MRKLWDRIWAANPYLVDGLIAAFLLLTSMGSMLHANDSVPRRDADALGVVLVLATTVPIAWRRRSPLPVLAIVASANAAFFLRNYEDGSITLAVAIAVWTVVTRDPQRRVALVAAIGLPLIPLAWIFNTHPSLIGSAISTALFMAGAAITGHNVRLRREKRAEEDRAVTAIAGREVADERLRIARELHDVVAHAMSIVAVQAGVAAHVIDTQPDEAKRMLENVRVTSHEALDEMRRLLGVLRGDAALAPAPGLHDVEALAESLRTAGIPVTITIDGTPTAVPAGVDLTAYRIVQEALTNVVKHAGPAVAAEVHLQYADGTVVVEVTDDGRGGVAGDGGHGLLGMRERVAVFGGELTTGPKVGGGFRVRATLPYGRS